MVRPAPAETLDDRPFKLRLIRGLGLAAVTYAPELVMPHEFVERSTTLKFMEELARLALHAAKKGELPGRLGLDYIESDIFRYTLPYPKIVFHGSPYLLDSLKPRQAASDDIYPDKPYRFADGPPALCASTSTAFPALRAILHKGHPEIAEQPMHLRRGVDGQGRVNWFTSEETLEAAHATDMTGKVYALPLGVGSRLDTAPPQYNAARDEYRIYGPRTPIVGVTVSAADLPPDLCIIPAADQPKLSLLKFYDHVLHWGRELQVPVRPLGGLWPKEYEAHG